MALDVSQNPKDKGNLILWPFENHNNQKYQIKAVDGHWMIINLHFHDAVVV
jgi:hypothetical protein